MRFSFKNANRLDRIITVFVGFQFPLLGPTTK
jgi:hypothetical protein